MAVIRGLTSLTIATRRALLSSGQLMNELEEGTKVLERQVGEEVSIYPNDGDFTYEIVIETLVPGEDDEFSLHPCDK